MVTTTIKMRNTNEEVGDGDYNEDQRVVMTITMRSGDGEQLEHSDDDHG